MLGNLSVHGAAVVVSRRALVFLAPSGWGKSTIAAAFHRRGFEILTDDRLRLEVTAEGQLVATPIDRCLRLWPETASQLMPGGAFAAVTGEKHRLELDIAGNRSAGQSVAAIFTLGSPCSTVSCEFRPLSASVAVATLVANCFRPDPYDADTVQQIFQACVEVVNVVPVIELDYKRDLASLDHVHGRVLEYVDALLGATP